MSIRSSWWCIPVLLVGCNSSEPMTSAVGSYSDIAIVTDLNELKPVAQMLQRVLAIELEYSLKPELLFNVDVFDMSDKRNANVYKNVIVVGLVDGKDKGSRELRRQLGGETLDSNQRDLFVAVVDDVYARNQTVFFIAGEERNRMQSAIRRGRDQLVHRIQASNRERVREYLFSDGHELELETRIAREMGFRLEVPASYRETRFLVGDNEGVLEVAAVRPTRAVAIFYRDGVSAEILEDSEVLLAQRREWGDKFLEERLPAEGGFTWSQEPFGHRVLPAVSGFWEAREETFGGPFVTFFLYEESKERLYGINLLCYAPGMKKHPYMRETMAIAETLDP